LKKEGKRLIGILGRMPRSLRIYVPNTAVGERGFREKKKGECPGARPAGIE